MAKAHYVDNKEFLQIIKDWRVKLNEAEENGQPRPRIPDSAGKILMMIAQRYSLRPNFRNYPFRDDMVLQAIEAAVKAFPSFNAELYSNPLAYFTQCIHFSFIGTITKEKKMLYTKVKMIQEGGLDFFDTLEHDETINSSQKDYLLSFLEKNEHEIEFKFLDKAEKEPKPEQQKKVIVSPLDELFD
jgi:hypothetical protein